MSDDDITDDDLDLDEEDLDDEDLDEDLPDDEDDDDDEDDEDEDDEDDDDENDLEADLDTILKDKISSGEDLDDDEEEPQAAPAAPESPEGVSAKREGEFTCQGCFIIVHPRQFGRRDAPVCPEGFEDCPSLDLVRRDS